MVFLGVIQSVAMNWRVLLAVVEGAVSSYVGRCLERQVTFTHCKAVKGPYTTLQSVNVTACVLDSIGSDGGCC